MIKKHLLQPSCSPCRTMKTIDIGSKMPCSASDSVRGDCAVTVSVTGAPNAARPSFLSFLRPVCRCRLIRRQGFAFWDPNSSAFLEATAKIMAGLDSLATLQAELQRIGKNQLALRSAIENDKAIVLHPSHLVTTSPLTSSAPFGTVYLARAQTCTCLTPNAACTGVGRGR